MLRRLINLMIIGGLVLGLFAAAAPFLLDAQGRAMLARQKSELQTMAIALEAYHEDHGAYPPMAMRVGRNQIAVPTHNGQAIVAGDTVDFRNDYSPAQGRLSDGFIRGRTFRGWSGTNQGPEQFAMLTSPVAYLFKHGIDTNTDQILPLRYHATQDGFIIGSFGPDRDEKTGGDLPWAAPFAGFDNPLPPPGSMEAVFDTRIPQPSPALLTGWAVGPGKGFYTYNPANGTFSEGDIWRIGGKAGTGSSP